MTMPSAHKDHRKMHIRRKPALLILAAILLLAQAIRPARSNPPIVASQTIYASSLIRPDVQSIFERSCKDCHSDATTWPWYSGIAPVSWLVAHDVHHGRSKLNLSEWAAYSKKKKDQRLAEICDQVRSGDMPDSLYTMIHRGARLTSAERASICAWADSARDALLRGATGTAGSQP
jgi:Haem-binding domain